MQTILDSVYAGRVGVMPGDGRPTAIFKQPCAGEVQVGRLGLLDDEQADRRVHGGPEKAVHQFSRLNLPRLRAVFAQCAQALVPGAFGENLSTPDWDEGDVCIGDVFAAGTVRLQLCQPRTPCWKIDARFAVDGMTKFVAAHGIAGWYYRVLAPGILRAGDTLQLVERQADAVSVREFWQLRDDPRPDLSRLQTLQCMPGLASQWQTRLAERIDWLRRNA